MKNNVIFLVKLNNVTLLAFMPIDWRCYIQSGCKSVGLQASVWGKTTLITGSVGGAGAGPPTLKMGTFFHIPLALTMPISNNFQLNRASGETPKLWVLQ